MADEAEADGVLDQSELELRRLYGQAALHIQKLQQSEERLNSIVDAHVATIANLRAQLAAVGGAPPLEPLPTQEQAQRNAARVYGKSTESERLESGRMQQDHFFRVSKTGKTAISITSQSSGGLTRGCTSVSHSCCSFNSSSTPSVDFLTHCVAASVRGLKDGGDYDEVSLQPQVGEGWTKMQVLPWANVQNALQKAEYLTDFEDHYTQFDTVGVYSQQVTLPANGNSGSGHYIFPRKGARTKFSYGTELSNSLFHIGRLMERDLQQYARQVYDADKIGNKIRSDWLVQVQRKEGCRAKTCRVHDRFDFTA